MNVLELYAGCGGAHTGLRDVLRRLGGAHRSVAVEIDPSEDGIGDAAARVFALNHPGVTVHAQTVAAFIAEQRVKPFGSELDVDLLWASPPCQPHSRAGKRLGEADARDGWADTREAIKVFKPAWFVVENVRGAPMERWAESVNILGYNVAVWDLDAADFGVPQHRHRRFLVGETILPGRALTPPAPTHGPGTGRPWVSMREALRLPLSVVAVGGGHNPSRAGDRRTELDLSDRPSLQQHPDWWHRDGPVDEPSRTVSTRGNNQVSYRRDDATGEVVYPPSVGSRAATEPARLDRPSPTVTCQEGKGTRANSRSGWTFHGGPDRAADAVFLGNGRRRLTPEECAVLQGFPVGYDFGEYPKYVRYKMIGNAVPPHLAAVVVAQLLGVAP